MKISLVAKLKSLRKARTKIGYQVRLRIVTIYNINFGLRGQRAICQRALIKKLMKISRIVFKL